MKKTLLFLMLSTLFIPDIEAHNPTDSVLLNKYWNFRERFSSRFVRIGDRPGFSMPIEQYLYSDCRQDWIWWNYPPQYIQDGFGILSPGGDQTCNLGHYIGWLSTEYALLSQNNQPTDSVVRELYFALKAYYRLERSANEIFRNPNYFGYFLRQDAPNDLHLAFQDASVSPGKKPVCTISEEVQRQYSKDSLVTNFTSQDQVVHLMYGMALAKRYIPSALMYNGESILALAVEASRRMIFRFYTDAWDLKNPRGQSVGNERGGQAQPWAYAFDKTWAYINPQGKTFGDYTFNIVDAILKGIYDCCGHLGGITHFYNRRLFISLASTSNTKTITYNFDYTMQDGLWIYPVTQGLLYNLRLDSNRELRLMDTLYAALTQAPDSGTCININNGNPDCVQSPAGWRGQNRWFGNIATRDTITDTNNHPADHYGLDYLLAYNLYRLYTNPSGYRNTHISFPTFSKPYSTNKTTDVQIYPNPAENELKIQYYLTVPKTITMKLYDITGRLVKNITDNNIMTYGHHETVADLSGLSANTYLLMIQLDGEVIRKKIVKY
ncbi:MAG: T9SS type A sorting domain-containing protein [Sphingobacteriales bacterium]|nr:T9SS type A sorting domain-containing protein [Sphingobacteriales bacterium]